MLQASSGRVILTNENTALGGMVNLSLSYTTIIQIFHLREALGNKTLVLLQRARRASTPGPLGRVVECSG